MLLFKYYLKNSEIIFCIGLLKKNIGSYKKIRCFKVAKKPKIVWDLTKHLIGCIKCLDSEKHQDRYFWSIIDK